MNTFDETVSKDRKLLDSKRRRRISIPLRGVRTLWSAGGRNEGGRFEIGINELSVVF